MQCIQYVSYSAVYNVCIIYNSIYQYVRLCNDVWLNEAGHIWHIDRVTEQWQNLKQVSIYDSLPVCQIIKQFDICCCLLLSLAIPYLCAFSVPAVCYLGIAFYCIAVNVLCCLCEDFCFLVLLCLVLCLVILLYYSNCIIMFLTIWYLLHIIIYNTIQYRKK